MDSVQAQPTNASPAVRLLSLATAVPPHRLSQSDATAMARQVFSGRFRDFDRIERVFESAGIRSRFMVRPAEWYLSSGLG